MEYTNKKQTENLLRLKSFHNLKMQVSLHASLNTCKGVVRCPDLKGVSEEEILEEMREQGVIHVRRIKVRRDDALKDTNFHACQVFGHHEHKCHREEICANCGQPKHSADETD